jgi:hypothetical protein
MPTPLREAAIAAIMAQLVATLPAVPVDRNRRAPPDLVREPLPRLAVLDGDHQVQGSDAHGTVLYRVQVLVLGHVTAASDATLGAAINDLHASTVAALCNQEILVAGEQNIWPQEEGMQMIPFAATESETPFMGFALTIGFDLRVPDATGPYTTT